MKVVVVVKKGMVVSVVVVMAWCPISDPTHPSSSRNIRPANRHYCVPRMLLLLPRLLPPAVPSPVRLPTSHPPPPTHSTPPATTHPPTPATTMNNTATASDTLLCLVRYQHPSAKPQHYSLESTHQLNFKLAILTSLKHLQFECTINMA